MSSLHHLPQFASEYSTADTLVALSNLATVRTQMDSLHNFIVDSLNNKILLPTHQINRVNSELTYAIHQVFINGATLLSSTQTLTTRPVLTDPDPNNEIIDESDKDEDKIGVDDDIEIVELDAVELLAEHIHFCEFCGKGFKRDANLRMHMRAHGNQFKSRESLSKPDKPVGNPVEKTRFSCPYNGCNRNRKHRNFRPLKSVICVKNHFKRTHCPKTFSCNRCNRKSFSVMADLKSHMKSCGNSKWKCSCGTTFSRKDKLFSHMALFEGHMPAVMAVADETTVSSSVDHADDELLLEDLLGDFGSVDNQCLQELMEINNGCVGSSSSPAANLSFNNKINDFFNF